MVVRPTTPLNCNWTQFSLFLVPVILLLQHLALDKRLKKLRLKFLFHVYKVRKVMFLPSHEVHGAALISVFSFQPDTSLHCQTTDTGLVHRAVCLFTSQLLLVLIAPTHGEMARLNWPGWLTTYRDDLPDYQLSPIQVLTGPDVD